MFLVSNDVGSWILLNEDAFYKFKSGKFQDDETLFKNLISSGIVLQKNGMQKLHDKAREKLWFLYNGPSLHVVAVTDNCNLGCKYCYASTQKSSNMSEEIAKKTAEFIFKTPSKSVIVEFSGGEPLMNFDAIKTIVKESQRLSKEKKKKVGFSIINNGTRWDDEKLKFFVDNEIGVCFSLDGPKELHDSHRRFLNGGATHEIVTTWIKKFRKINYPFLHALPVITKYSLPLWKEIVDEYVQLGFRNFRFKYLGYFGRAAEIWDELGYSPEEYIETWKKVVDYIYELNKNGIEVVEEMASLMAKKLYGIRDPGYCELQMPCGAGISQLAYAPDGSVHTCDEGRMFEEFKIGNVSQNLSEVLLNNTVKGLVVASSGFTNLCDNCALKPFCGLCPVEEYKMSGDIQSKVPIYRRCKIHGAMSEHLIYKTFKDPEFEKLLKKWATNPKIIK